MRFFHEITDDKWAAMCEAGMNWMQVSEQFREPEWCGHGRSALHGGAGCWSLVGRKVTGRDFCRNCDAYCEVGLATADKIDAKADFLAVQGN